MKITLKTLIILLALSCNSKENFHSHQSSKDQIQLISVEQLNHHHTILLDSIYEIETIIDLESPESIFIGAHDKVLTTDSAIFILDRDRTHSIFAFGKNGKFLYKIDDLGQGPDEYQELRDFTILTSDSLVEILDFAGRKILKYQMGTGYFLNSTQLDKNTYYGALESSQGYYTFAHNNICGLLGDCYNLTLFNQKSTKETSLLLIPKNLRNYDLKPSQIFSRNVDNIYFKELFNDTIYKINFVKPQLEAAFAIDLGDQKVSNDFLYSNKNKSSNDIINYAIQENKSLEIKDFYIGDSIVYFTYGFPKLRQVFFDQKKKIGLTFERFTTNNLLLLGEIIGVSENQFVTILSDEKLMELKKSFNDLDSTSYMNNFSEFYQLIKSRKSGSSPIIVLIKVNIK